MARTVDWQKNQAVQEVLGNSTADGIMNSVRISAPDLAAQLAATSPLRDILAATAGNMNFYASKAQMDADIERQEPYWGWLLADDNVANVGIWRFVEGDPPVWERILDLPFAGFMLASHAGGTADAIEAETSLPIPVVPGAALVFLEIVAPNTAEAVTVDYNGTGPLPVRLNSGLDTIPVGYLKPGIVAGIVRDGRYQLLSYGDPEAAMAAVEAIYSLMLGLIGTVPMEDVPVVPSETGLEALTIPTGLNHLLVKGEATATDTRLPVPYVRVASEPSTKRKVRSTDRFLPDGSSDSDDGGWWMGPNMPIGSVASISGFAGSSKLSDRIWCEDRNAWFSRLAPGFTAIEHLRVQDAAGNYWLRDPGAITPAVTVRVPEDFSTVPAAVAFLMHYRLARTEMATVLINSSYALTNGDQLDINRGDDASKIVLQSTADSLTLAGGFNLSTALIRVRNGSSGPLLGETFKLDCGGKGARIYECNEFSRGYALPGFGITNSDGIAIYLNRHCEFSRAGGTADVRSDLTGNAINAVWLDHNCMLHMRFTDCDDTGNAAFRIMSKSVADVEGCTATNCGHAGATPGTTAAIRLERGGEIISATPGWPMDISDSKRGLDIRGGSIATLPYLIAHGVLGNAIHSIEGSKTIAYGCDIADGGTDGTLDNVFLEDGSEFNYRSGSITGAARHNLRLQSGSRSTGHAATLTGAGNTDLSVVNASHADHGTGDIGTMNIAINTIASDGSLIRRSA